MEEQNQTEIIDKMLADYEKNLSWKRGGSVVDRVSHCLSQYKQIADNAIWQAKSFLEDCKTQYKALEIITEGLTSQGLNHGQKRTIANHIITMLRSMVDKLDNADYTYTTNFIDRYNFFRSNTPEQRIYEERKELSDKVKRMEETISGLKQKHPEIFPDDEIPF